MGCIIQLEGAISRVHSCVFQAALRVHKGIRDVMGELTK